MYYPDLSVYRIGRNEKGYTIYPSIKNIGWLSPEFNFNTGSVSEEFCFNLKELLFVGIANNEHRRNANLSEIIINENYVRSPPMNCPICNDSVVIKPNKGGYYTGEKSKHLGNSEIEIYDLENNISYCFPTLIYHYVEEHNYVPPQRFVDAIVNFDFKRPYDVSNRDVAIDSKKVSANEMYSLDKELEELGTYHD